MYWCANQTGIFMLAFFNCCVISPAPSDCLSHCFCLCSVLSNLCHSASMLLYIKCSLSLAHWLSFCLGFSVLPSLFFTPTSFSLYSRFRAFCQSFQTQSSQSIKIAYIAFPPPDERGVSLRCSCCIDHSYGIQANGFFLLAIHNSLPCQHPHHPVHAFIVSICLLTWFAASELLDISETWWLLADAIWPDGGLAGWSSVSLASL